MSKKDIDKELINHLNNLYQDSDDIGFNEQANLNQDKPFTILEEEVKTDDEDKSVSPSQYDFFGITGSK